MLKHVWLSLIGMSVILTTIKNKNNLKHLYEEYGNADFNAHIYDIDEVKIVVIECWLIF